MTKTNDCVNTIPNPDYIPAVDGYWIEKENPDYIPGKDGYYETIPNPDYIPGTPEQIINVGFMKWNWTGGPTHTTPSFPSETGGWHQVGITNDTKGSIPGVVHKGNGKASYFYFEPVTEIIPAVPEVGTEYIDIWVDGEEAIGTPTIDVWVEGTPAIGDEYLINECPAPNENFVTTFSPVVSEDCGDVFWSHPSFKGGFGIPTEYLVSVNSGELTPYTPGEIIQVGSEGSEWSVTLKAKYEGLTFEHQLGQQKGVSVMCEVEVPVIECPENKVPGWIDENGNPTGCVDNNPNPGGPKEPPVIEEDVEFVPTKTVGTKENIDTIEQTVVSVSESPEELAYTGSSDPFMGGLLGVALLASGASLMIRKRFKISQ